MKFFVSYRRKSDDDKSLALFLSAELEKAGHEVFIDTKIKVGTDWVSEISKRIDWCDYFVVLISEESMCSEMVQGEIRSAYQRRKQDGTPNILPIRLNYFESLDYELDSYLSQLQYLEWRSEDNNQHILAEILEVAATGSSEGMLNPDLGTESIPIEENQKESAPKPQVDPRILRAPGGSIRFDDPLYIKRPVDETIERNIQANGETIVIKAARQMGKSSMLIRYLAASKNHGKEIFYLDFQSFTDNELDDYSVLLTQIAEAMIRSLRLNVDADLDIQSQQDLTNFIEDHVFRTINKPLVFAFDEVDRVLGRDYQADFFSMFRLWHNRRAEFMSEGWPDLDIALVIATEPNLLIDTADRSPFNVTPAIKPDYFEYSHISRVNQLFGSSLDSSQLQELFKLLSGHPFLTRLAFYRLFGPEEYSLDQLIESAADEEGPFSDHLRHLLMKVEQAGLVKTLKYILDHNTAPDNDSYYRLHGAGLVNREGNKVILANKLYERFFKKIL